MDAFLPFLEQFGVPGAKVLALCGSVMVIIQTLKLFVPQIQGDIARYITVGVAILLAVVQFYPQGAIPTVIAAIGTIIGSLGGYSLVQKAGGQGITPPTNP